MARDRPDQHDDPLRNQKREQLAHCDSPFLALWLGDQFAALHDKLDRIGRLIMVSTQDLKNELIEIKASTDANSVTLSEMQATDVELAADIDSLLAQSNPNLDEALALLKEAKGTISSQSSQLATMSASLKNTASKHTPGSQP